MFPCRGLNPQLGLRNVSRYPLSSDWQNGSCYVLITNFGTKMVFCNLFGLNYTDLIFHLQTSASKIKTQQQYSSRLAKRRAQTIQWRVVEIAILISFGRGRFYVHVFEISIFRPWLRNLLSTWIIRTERSLVSFHFRCNGPRSAM